MENALKQEGMLAARGLKIDGGFVDPTGDLTYKMDTVNSN